MMNPKYLKIALSGIHFSMWNKNLWRVYSRRDQTSSPNAIISAIATYEKEGESSLT